MLEPAGTALLLLHWQNDLAHERGQLAGALPGILAASGAVERTRAALTASRRQEITVGYVSASHRPGYPEVPATPAPLVAGVRDAGAFVRGSWGAEVIDELRPADGDLEFLNSSPSAFVGTDLDLALRNRGITTLVLTGLVTNWVVETTAREALCRGYAVCTLADCCASWDADAHNWSVTRILPMIGAVSDSEAYVQALARQSESD